MAEIPLNRRVTLDQLKVVHPCPADFVAMRREGTDRRFCDHCRKHVHDLSLMTASEAERVICEMAGNGLCVRMARDSDGVVITLDYQPRRPLARWRRWPMVTLAVAIAAALAAFLHSTRTIGNTASFVVGELSMPTPTAPKMGAVIMGDIAPSQLPMGPTQARGDAVQH